MAQFFLNHVLSAIGVNIKKNLLQTDTVPAMLLATFMNLPQTLLASGSVAAMAGLSLRLAIAVPPGI